MDELACFMDWDLEAIVRGCSIEAPAANIMEDPHPNFSQYHFCSEVQDDLLFSFPEFSETTRVFDELEELYKPFYPILQTLSPQTIVTSPLPIPNKEPVEVKALKPSQKVAQQDLQVPTVSKSKRSKKNLKKRVVKQVTAADIGLCDAWAWRKYGQKPIKGSPYPRSYYRCSSSKGCLARKQVERNHLDPGVFMVTYTSEHNHPHPTRRNSLAGSSRKNTSIIAPPSAYCDQKTPCSSNSSAPSLSPRTPLVVQSMEDELVTSTVQQSKGLEKEEGFVEVLDDAEGAEFGDGNWFPTTELYELMGLNQELALRSTDFRDGFAAT